MMREDVIGGGRGLLCVDEGRDFKDDVDTGTLRWKLRNGRCGAEELQMPCYHTFDVPFWRI